MLCFIVLASFDCCRWGGFCDANGYGCGSVQSAQCTHCTETYAADLKQSHNTFICFWHGFYPIEYLCVAAIFFLCFSFSMFACCHNPQYAISPTHNIALHRLISGATFPSGNNSKMNTLPVQWLRVLGLEKQFPSTYYGYGEFSNKSTFENK